jgi:uncharacterized protein
LQLVETARAEHRTVLSRDRRLLMRGSVTHGHLVRHTEPRAQFAEVLDRFDKIRIAATGRGVKSSG